jgi:hypothetical protein
MSSLVGAGVACPELGTRMNVNNLDALMAFSGHLFCTAECPLLGVKRT